jgi:hypothetical protein
MPRTTKKLEESLFSDFPKTPGYPSNEKLQGHLIEQYKLYVEMADRVSARRQTGNSYFLSVNTALLGFVGYVAMKDETDYLWLLGIVGLALCVFWVTMLVSFKNLNSAKFKVIHAVEQKLPLRLYDAEWDLVGRGKDAERYRPLSHIEIGVPWVFGALHGYVFVTTLPWERIVDFFRA